jgi:polyisoprenoid-binding protein YceI
MWFGNTEAGNDETKSHSAVLPISAALAAWVLAIGIGASLGLFAKHETTAAAVALAEVDSEWTVESGTLAISVVQLSSDVQGQFADWTAAITFDETAEGTLGNVTVTIAIPSVTIGSVTSEALKPEYFNADAHPTAEFVADITRADTGYLASGALTLKGKTVPVDLPFDLVLDGNRAEMQGSVTVDRRDFGIGPESESSVKHPVNISVELVATR